MACVYAIVNLINDMTYIGSSKDFKNRKNQHMYSLKLNTHHNTHLQNSWNKYGEDNFEFKVLEECNDDCRFDIEQKYIDEYLDDWGKCYNISKNAKVGVWNNEEQNIVSKLTEEEVVIIKKRIVNGENLRDISADYDISGGTISCIKNLNSWVSTGQEFNDELIKMCSKKEVMELKDEILLDYINGVSIDNMCEKYGFKPSTILKKVIYPYNNEIKINKARENNKTKICKCCGKEYIYKNNSQKYCGKKCAKKINLNKTKNKYKKSSKQQSKEITNGN